MGVGLKFADGWKRAVSAPDGGCILSIRLPDVAVLLCCPPSVTGCPCTTARQP